MVRFPNLLYNPFQVFKFTASKLGLMDLNIYDYELVFGTDVNLKLDKAQRLIYGDSEMTHAMVITAIHEEVRKKELCQPGTNLFFKAFTNLCYV